MHRPSHSPHFQPLPARTLTLPIALALAAAAVGCAADARESTAAEHDAITAEALVLDEQRCPRLEVFAPGVISTEADEGRLVFSPDGNTAYFHRATSAERTVILESRRGRGDSWSTPTLVSFSGTPYSDFDPHVSPDGSKFFFSSDRPTDGGTTARPDWEVWVSTRTRSGWSEPVHLGPEINTPANELYPTTTADGTLYFNSDREGGLGAWDIYRAVRSGGGFANAQNAGAGLNTENWEFNPMPSLDGRFIVFGSIGRPDNLGAADLYATIRDGSAWKPARHLGPCINTAASEYHPTLAWSRGSLIFVRNVGAGGDFYELRLDTAFQ